MPFTTIVYVDQVMTNCFGEDAYCGWVKKVMAITKTCYTEELSLPKHGHDHSDGEASSEKGNMAGSEDNEGREKDPMDILLEEVSLYYSDLDTSMSLLIFF